MLSAKGFLYAPRGNRAMRDLLASSSTAGITGLQLFGSRPEIMREAAQQLSGMGFQFIDINMGCPMPKITSNGEGAALMLDLKSAGSIIRATVLGSSVPVTIKTRSGWAGDKINAVELALMAEAEGAAAIAVHARTRDQMYSGKADWSVITRVKNAVKIPVIGNGDVRSAEDAVGMIKETGCDMVMVARAACGNPWIFRDIKQALNGLSTHCAVSPREKINMALRHLDMALLHKSERTAVREMRKHLASYIAGFCGSAAMRDRINRLETAAALKEALLEYADMLVRGASGARLP
jgi:nifR3 family TIM-barrel protein